MLIIIFVFWWIFRLYINGIFTKLIAEVCPDDDELGRISASEAEKIAQSFTSSFPHFTQVMKRFNISGSYTLVGSSYISLIV